MVRSPHGRRKWSLLAGRVFALSFLLFLVVSLCTQNVISTNDPPRKVTAQLDAQTIAGAVRMFTVRHHRLPALDELSKSLDGSEPIFDELPQDPWLHDFVLRSIGPRLTDFEVVSAGPDGVLDTGDDIRSRTGH